VDNFSLLFIGNKKTSFCHFGQLCMIRFFIEPFL